MHIDELVEYGLSKPGTEETFPFDEVTLVIKVMGKMYLLIPTDQEEMRINLKCDPDRAVQLRESNESIIPGFHMNKKHWNTIILDGSLSNDFIKELIDHSYDLVVKSLTKKLKTELAALDES